LALRRIEMEMRIVVGEAGSASALAERLVVAFGADRVSLWGDRPEVGVRVEGESDRTVLGVLDTVERWLDHAGFGSAEMWLGQNSYRVARWAPVEGWE
jgi:hypothetical protein